jgi:hypothetical protein
MRLTAAAGTWKQSPIGYSCRSELVVRDRIELSTFRFSGGRSYRLSYLTEAGRRLSFTARDQKPNLAVLTGFEPATSTLTGWRALQAALQDQAFAGKPSPDNPTCPQRDSNPCRRLERAVS